MIEAVETNVVLVLIVWALAAYRQTRLIVFDDILGTYPDIVEDDDGDEHPRQLIDEEGAPRYWADDSAMFDRGTGLRKVIDLILFDRKAEARNPFTRWLGKLYTCPYCVGVWMTAFTMLLWQLGGAPGRWFLVGCAVAGAQCFMASRPGG